MLKFSDRHMKKEKHGGARIYKKVFIVFSFVFWFMVGRRGLEPREFVRTTALQAAPLPCTG